MKQLIKTMNATILPGVELGDHTVVGAGSVVTRSFPEGYYVIAGTQPDWCAIWTKASASSIRASTSITATSPKLTLRSFGASDSRCRSLELTPQGGNQHNA